MRILIAIFALFTLVACSEPLPDEERIQQRIDFMVEAVGNKKLSPVMEPIHEDFLGNERIRKANLRGMIVLHNRRHKNIHVFVHNIEIELDQDNAATVRCNVILAGRNELVPEQGRVLKVTSRWKRIDDDWYVMSASWKDPILNP